MPTLHKFRTGRKHKTQSSVKDQSWSEKANGSWFYLEIGTTAATATHAAKKIQKELPTRASFRSASGELCPLDKDYHGSQLCRK